MFDIFAHIIMSIIAIVILHNLYKYMESLYAPRKVRCMSELYSRKYEDIHNVLHSQYPKKSGDMNTSFASKSEREILVSDMNDLMSSFTSTNSNASNSQLENQDVKL